MVRAGAYFGLAGRYVGRAVFGGIALVLLCLLGLYTLVDLLRELRAAGGGYQLWAILDFLLKTTPGRLYEVFPFAVLIGALLGLGNLTAHHELTALRAAGLSRLSLAGMAMVAGASALAGVMLITELLMPSLEARARADRQAAQTGEVRLGGSGGMWLRDGDLFMRIDQPLWQAAETLVFSGVTVYGVDDGFRPRTWLFAENARHRDGRWFLEDVRYLTYDTGGQPRGESRVELESRLDPDLFTASVTRPKFLSLMDLSELTDYLERNDLDAGAYREAFWERLFYPLGVLAMLALGLPFIFHSPRERGWGVRVLIGIGLGMGCFVINRMLQGTAGVLGIPSALAAATGPLLFLSVAVYLLARHR